MAGGAQPQMLAEERFRLSERNASLYFVTRNGSLCIEQLSNPLFLTCLHKTIVIEFCSVRRKEASADWRPSYIHQSSNNTVAYDIGNES